MNMRKTVLAICLSISLIGTGAGFATRYRPTSKPPAKGAPKKEAPKKEEGKKATACAASEECKKDEYCTTEDGACDRPPGCKPDDICADICYGVCRPRAEKRGH
jgi:hypothetical protein